MSRRTGSTLALQHAVFRSSASRSLSSLCRWMPNRPRLQNMAWSTMVYRFLFGNIISWLLMPWFDSITELPFIQIEAQFSEGKHCQPHRWPFFLLSTGSSAWLVFGSALSLNLSTVSKGARHSNKTEVTERCHSLLKLNWFNANTISLAHVYWYKNLIGKHSLGSDIFMSL